MKLRIVPMTAQHLPAVAALEKICFPADPWSEALFREALENPRAAVLLAQGEGLFLRLANPYAGTVDPEKIWAEGFSTKGEGRGLGLFSYQRILAEHPNTAVSTSWSGGVFVQELKVEGRP